jgi:hypothetical protein
LIHLRRRFYKYASPTDFAAFAPRLCRVERATRPLRSATCRPLARHKLGRQVAGQHRLVACATLHRKMILARRSSPAPSARHISRTKTKKTQSLTCLRHPLPSDSPRCRAVAAGGRGTKPRRGGIFFDNSPAFQGWDSSRTNIKVPSGTADDGGRAQAPFVPDGTRKFAGQFTQP